MFNYNPLDCLPSSVELPDSDDTSVDNELQILLPNLLYQVRVITYNKIYHVGWVERQ